MRRIEIYPSLLSADFSRLGEEMKAVEKAGANGFHLDVMDGHFVPNISFGPPVIRSIRKVTDLPLWAHLMIEEPGRYLDDYHKAGVEGIVIHTEIQEDAIELSSHIHNLHMEAGVSIKPDTDVRTLEGILDHFERVLIMTVQPGFGGQSLIPNPLKKIPVIRAMSKGRKKSLIIEVDGGVNEQTVIQVVQAGAEALVAGSAIFHQPNPAQALKRLRDLTDTALNDRNCQ
jgi:ribulose-phosphate 3-epimerase